MRNHPTATERFWGKFARNPDTGCWLWTRAVDPQTGYARFHVDGATVNGHRWIYELIIGPIPAGLEIDHLCRVRSCVNPLHLEAVTAAENLRRGRAAAAAA